MAEENKQNRVYRAAIVGCGVMGEVHVMNTYYLDNIQYVWACDIDDKKTSAFCRKYSIPNATDQFLDVVKDPSIDIVILATPPSLHLSMVKSCLQYGKHVLCEKPIAPTIEDCEAFAKAVQEHPECKVLVGHILRHNQTYQKVADMIQSGAIGHPIVMRMVQNHHTMNWPLYLANIKESAPLVNCGIHYVDVMEWFTGAHVIKVQAMGSRTQSDVPEDTYNYGMMMLKLSDDSVGYYEAGWTNTCSAVNIKEFIGPKGRINLIYQKDRQEHPEEGDLIEYYQYPEKTYRIINSPCNRKPTDTQLEYLIKMIETNQEPVPTIDQMLDCMRTCLEADAQARQWSAGMNPDL